jgi:hypothetical protein
MQLTAWFLWLNSGGWRRITGKTPWLTRTRGTKIKIRKTGRIRVSSGRARIHNVSKGKMTTRIMAGVNKATVITRTTSSVVER